MSAKVPHCAMRSSCPDEVRKGCHVINHCTTIQVSPRATMKRRYPHGLFTHADSYRHHQWLCLRKRDRSRHRLELPTSVQGSMIRWIFVGWLMGQGDAHPLQDAVLALLACREHHCTAEHVVLCIASTHSACEDVVLHNNRVAYTTTVVQLRTRPTPEAGAP